ncbi:MAG: choice-of-anchor J domain-containing protein [Saprospiraceae bacterium]
MKQNLLLFTFLFSIIYSNSQVLYYQDFTNGKDDMITIDVDKNIANAQVTLLDGSWVVTDALTSGNPAAVNNSYYEPAGKADDWLITPQIIGITEKTILTWAAFVGNSTYPNTYRVMISPSGGANVSDFTDVLLDVGPENPYITVRNVSLKDYIGKNIRIAFHDYSDDLLVLLVDDIVVYNLLDIDGQIDNVSSVSYAVKNDDVDIEFSVSNMGYIRITSMVLEATDGVTTEEINLGNLDLAFSETYKGIYTYRIANIAKNEVRIKIKSINGQTDLNNTNDLGSTKVYGVNKRIHKKMLAEEATGTWSSWSPRGAVFKAQMKSDYPNDFIGISVHHDDPMKVSAYSNGIRQLPGFSKYPSAVINREKIIDPEEMLDYFTELVSKQVAPVDISVEQSIVDRKITIKGAVEFHSNITDADFSVVVVVVEDGVKGNSAAFDQANSYSGGGNGPMGGYENLPNPVPASQMVYNEVARAIPFGFNGANNIIPDSIKVGDTFLFSVDYTSPTAQKIANLHSVAFVVNNTSGQVENAAQTPSFAVNVDDILELDQVSLSPNPTNNISYLDINLNKMSDVTVNISNSLGQIVASRKYGKFSGLQSLPILTDNFSTGMYYVQLMVNGKSTVQKLIVE